MQSSLLSKELFHLLIHLCDTFFDFQQKLHQMKSRTFNFSGRSEEGSHISEWRETARPVWNVGRQGGMQLVEIL